MLIAVLLIFSVVAMGVLVATTMSGADITDSNLSGYGIEAQFAAESGVERALEEFSNAAYAPPPAAAVNPCVAGSFTAGPYTVTSGRTFTTTFKAATDFGASALPFSQCRVQVTGTVTGTGVSRTVQAILDRNLAAGANPDFNDIVGGGATAISQWTSVAAPIPFDTAGGTDTAPTAGVPTRCTRAAYAVKPKNAPATTAQARGSVAIVPNFRVTTGVIQTVTVRFNYRVIQIGNSGVNTCVTTAAGVAIPGGATANDLHVWFRLTDTAANQYTTAAARVFVVAAATNPGAPLNARTVVGAACTPTTQQANAATDYGTCAKWYQGIAAPVPATNKGQSTVAIAAASTGLINQLEYFINLRGAGNAREAWIDNIELINSSATRVARTAEWRDCSVSTCP